MCEGRMRPGRYGWYCPDCDTYLPDSETDQIASEWFEAKTPNLKVIIDERANLTKLDVWAALGAAAVARASE